MKNVKDLESQTEAKPKPNISAVTSAVITYMAFSSTMLVTNKAAVSFFPAPSTLLWLQMAVSALIVWILGQMKYLDVTPLEWDKAQKYLGVVASFIFNLFTNIKALQYTNVETVIVFQTLTSLGVAYGDYKLLKNAMPSPQTILALLIIVFGSICYVLTDSNF
jgi:solute carrier family 35 protein